MKTLEELCNSELAQDASNELLREACSLPRTPADKRPLPDPKAEAAFDSSWEVVQEADKKTKTR